MSMQWCAGRCVCSLTRPIFFFSICTSCDLCFPGTHCFCIWPAHCGHLFRAQHGKRTRRSTTTRQHGQRTNGIAAAAEGGIKKLGDAANLSCLPWNGPLALNTARNTRPRQRTSAATCYYLYTIRAANALSRQRGRRGLPGMRASRADRAVLPFAARRAACSWPERRRVRERRRDTQATTRNREVHACPGANSRA